MSVDPQTPVAASPAAPPSVPFVGLTGGLAAGKSTALAALERLGARTLSTDEVVHELYAGEELRDLVVARWGSRVAPSGTVDRAEIAKVVFHDADERAWLEQQIWPRVGAAVVAFREDAAAQHPPARAAVVETPLLFEAGMEAAYDATIAIVAPDDLRGDRARQRGHDGIEGREARHLAQEEKAARATYTVVNDGTVQQLEERLAAILDALAP
jgi:dephospho-CoA kinase